MRLKDFIYKLLLKLKISPSCFYINGPETLPEPLSAERERELVEEGSEKAKEELIVHNLRLVVFIARKFDGSAGNLEDLISIGTIGLIKAVNTFCAEKNIKLATYASRCIENEILMYLRKTSSRKNEISIDEPINVDYDGNELLISDILGSDSDEISLHIEQEDERSLLRLIVGELPERERVIMEMRFGLGGREEYTQKQVADILGISQSYISRLEKRIIKKIKVRIEKGMAGNATA
ncbi:MAG: sigma-70 family RNA polymerase sigma factor [Clostridia bacterium]|nr:sigma-70 family RNA polymerase sigma factor [Clostridia bacterium]